MLKKSLSISIISALALIASGCTSSGDTPKSAESPTTPNKAPQVEAKPATLSLYLELASEISDEEIDRFIREPLKKKHPHITIGEVIKNGKGTEYTTLISSGSFPDLAYTSNSYIQRYDDLAIAQELTALAKTHGFDFAKTFDTTTLNSYITYSGGKGQIKGMPFMANFKGTFYNKDIFDKFAVPYPKDLMTWDDSLEIIKKINRIDGGVQYIGFDPRQAAWVAEGLSLPLVDPVTLKSNLGTEAFRPVYQLFKDMYSIPGQVYNNAITWGLDGFFKTKNVAMRIAPIYGSILTAGTSDVNWDVTTIPNFKEKIGIERGPEDHTWMMSTTSKNKDAAFQVMAMLASPELQMEIARYGRVPAALPVSQYQPEYGAKVPYMKGKNFAGVFKAKRAELPPQTPYQTVVQGVLNSANNLLKDGTMDVNTLMRQLQEQSDAKIAEEKAKLGVK